MPVEKNAIFVDVLHARQAIRGDLPDEAVSASSARFQEIDVDIRV
jgi:hypothetical protein